ncbi:hypothetical protein [Verminephrobacter eiseniae]|uniref:hypothetical protein n=1 Tax=Verminephrobacter eiseniae TaxID=364317 RepID=UPI00223775B4|nr:hypothetical protein [Verminephrobacter eiseniae]
MEDPDDRLDFLNRSWANDGTHIPRPEQADVSPDVLALLSGIDICPGDVAVANHLANFVQRQHQGGEASRFFSLIRHGHLLSVPSD